MLVFSPPILQETLLFLCNDGFGVGMLEVDYFFNYDGCKLKSGVLRL